MGQLGGHDDRRPTVSGPTTIYLPWVEGSPARMTARACAFALAWVDIWGERASLMRCDLRLVRAAQGHATYLAARTPEQVAALDGIPHAMHMGSHGSFANERVLATGFRLPLFWLAAANNVESCTRSPFEPAQAAEELAAHAEHYDHMHGLGFFADHVLWGCGSAGEDFVAITAPEPPEVS